MSGIQAFNFLSSNDPNYVFSEQEYTPEDLGDKIPEEFRGNEKDSRDYARMYSLREKVKEDFGAEFTEIKKRPGGAEERISMLIQHIQPSDLSLAVSNGFVQIDPNQVLSEAQYKDLVRFCDMNNITNVTFPANVDEGFRKEFMDVYAHSGSAPENTAVLGYAPEGSFSNIDEEVRRRNNPPEDQNHENTGQPEPAPAQEPVTAQADPVPAAEKKKEEEKHPDLKKIEENMEKFMSPRSGKIKDRTYFKTKSNGELHYRIYAKPEDRESDGKWDKNTKTYKQNYEFDLKFSIVKGQMTCVFSSPGNKPIEGNYADEIVSMMKAQGYTTIDFGDIEDPDKGKFRDSCASFGVLPSFNLGEKQARGMLNKARDSYIVNLPGYKLRMADKLRSQIENGDKGMEHSDNKGVRAVIIECEAENGVVPKDMKFSETDVTKMSKIIKENLDTTEQLEFKRELVGKLKKQMQGDNTYDENNPLFELTKDMEEQVKYTPFKNVFVKQIQKHLDTVVKGEKGEMPDAVKVIGAADAAAELFDLYGEYADKTMDQFMKSNALNLDREKKEFMEKSGLKPEELPNLRLQDLGEKRLAVLYQVMIKEREEEAEQRIIKAKIEKKNDKDSNRDPVKDEVSAAYGRLKDVAADLSAMDLGRISAHSLGNPQFKPRQQNSQMQQAMHGAGGRS